MSEAATLPRTPRFHLRWPWRRREPQLLTYAREKKWLLGILAFLVALPFPMNEPQPDGVVSWAGVSLYLLLVGLFLWRVKAGRDATLPGWALNLLGLLYIPWFLFRLRTIGPVHIARPMVELLLFGLVVKLFSMRREKEKWHVSVLIFFLFVAAMATSVHPLILLYLLAFLVLWLVLLFRFVHLHLVATYRHSPAGAQPLSLQPFFIACILFTLLGAVPFFTLLPRLRTPYILGRGLSPGRPTYATGFRDEVNLDVVGNIRQNDAVALRLKLEDTSLDPPYLMRGTTYDEFRDNSWLKSRPRLAPLVPDGRSLYRLAPGEIRGKVRVWLEPLDSTSLILPAESLTVELARRLYGDVGGGVLMTQPRQGILEYRVGVANREVHRADPPALGDDEEPTLARNGVSEHIEELSERLAAGFGPAETAERIEQYLTHNYEYTLDFLGRKSDEPIEDFLFKYRSGHCEYFATAMILMLRSVDIPARLVTGFVGAEFNPLEDYYLVRQSNAHAWVEAWLPDRGWTTFDPTPPAGRPVVPVPSVGTLLRQAWDYMEFRWDRYVMSYGFFDQIGLLLRIRDFWRRFESPFDIASGSRDEGPEVEDRAPGGWDGLDPAAVGGLQVVGLLLLAGVAATLAVVVIVRRRRFDAIRAYRVLRATFGKREPSIGAATAPLALQRWIESHAPQAAEPAGQLIRWYLLESYGGRPASSCDPSALRGQLRRVRDGLRQAAAG